jgi:hypothetical protein
LKAEAQDAELAARTLLSARVSGWEANFPFPLAQARWLLGLGSLHWPAQDKASQAAWPGAKRACWLAACLPAGVSM